MALGDSKIIQGEPATVVFELNCAKSQQTGRKLQMAIFKLEQADIWTFVVNNFIQDRFTDFGKAVESALSYIGEQTNRPLAISA